MKEIENQPVYPKVKILVIDVEGTWKEITPLLSEKAEYYDTNSNRIKPFSLDDSALIRELFRTTMFKGIDAEYFDLSAQMNFFLQYAVSESRSMQELTDNIKH